MIFGGEATRLRARVDALEELLHNLSLIERVDDARIVAQGERIRALEADSQTEHLV